MTAGAMLAASIASAAPRWRWARRVAPALLLILTCASAVAPAAEGPRAVTDAAGRRVEVPARIERVYAAGGPASLLVYAVAPDKLVGWTRTLSPEERAYLPQRCAEPPNSPG